MPIKNIKRLGQIGIIMLLPTLIFAGVVAVIYNFTPVQAADIHDNATIVTKQQPASIPPHQGETCYCASDIYNCNNFDNQQDAQICFDYCQSVGRDDPHGLDSDNNGLACEELPPGPTPTATRPSAT